MSSPPTDHDRERAREIALRHIPEVGSQWPLAPGDRVVLCDSLRDAIVAALAEARSEGARAVLKALTGEDVPVEAQRAVEGM